MRSSRAPEGRGASKRILIFSVATVAIIFGVVFTYFPFGSGSLSAKDAQSTEPLEAAQTSPLPDEGAVAVGPTPSTQPTATPKPAPTTTPRPTATPRPTPKPTPVPTKAAAPTSTPQPTVGPTVEPETATIPRVLPDAEFGEVLEDGLVQLKLPTGDPVDTWYTFQVDTKSQDITVFFAVYDVASNALASTVKIDDYAKGEPLDNAEVTLYYANGSERILFFDGSDGTISLNQQYRLPYGPSMFTSGLRRALVYYGIKLQDEAGDVEVELHLDLSGLSESEALEFKRTVPGTVDDVLREIEGLVDQIEENRMQLQ